MSISSKDISTGYKYKDIMEAYKNSLKNFEDLTDIDSREKKFRDESKIRAEIINEGIYLMFKEGMSFARKYIKENKEISLLEECIKENEGNQIHRYCQNTDSEAQKNKFGVAHNILKDAKIAFYTGAKKSLDNPFGQDIYRKDFLDLLSKEKRYI